MYNELLQCIQESTKVDRLKDSLVKPSLDFLLDRGYKVDEEGVRHYLDTVFSLEFY